MTATPQANPKVSIALPVRGSRPARSSMTAHPRERPRSTVLEHQERSTRVGVVHENEILRRGLATCLNEDPQVHVVFSIVGGPPPEEVSVVVSAPEGAADGGYTCPVVLCVAERGAPPSVPVAAVVRWTSLTAEQLVASVRAAAAGFRLELPGPEAPGERGFDSRAIEVLRLLAQGAT